MGARLCEAFLVAFLLAVLLGSVSAHDAVGRRRPRTLTDDDVDFTRPVKRRFSDDMDDLVNMMARFSLHDSEDEPQQAMDLSNDESIPGPTGTKDPETTPGDVGSVELNSPEERRRREVVHARLMSEMTSAPESDGKPLPANEWIPGGNAVPALTTGDPPDVGDDGDTNDIEHNTHQADGSEAVIASEPDGTGSGGSDEDGYGSSLDSSDSGNEDERGLKGPHDSGSDNENRPKVVAAPGGRCPANWVRVCMNIMQDDDSDDYLSGTDAEKGASVEELCGRHLVGEVLAEEDKICCLEACKANLKQTRVVLTHDCQYEGGKWRRPSLGEATLLCSENQFKTLLGVNNDNDKVWGGIHYPGWNIRKDPMDALSYAFEKESKLLTFLNLYRPEWFPEGLWDDDDRMCEADTRRCVPPFCRMQSGMDKDKFRTFKPCISNNWQWKGDSLTWINGDGSTNSKKKDYPGLARVFACTHRKTPLEGLRCLRSGARKMQLNREEKQSVLSGYRWHMVKKAIKACIVGDLDMKCDDNGNFVNNVLGSRPLGDLMLYKAPSWPMWWDRLVKSQEGLRKSSRCGQAEPFMTAGTEKCLLSALSIHKLGNPFFDGDEVYIEWAPIMKTIYQDIKKRDRWHLEPLRDDEMDLVKDCSLPSTDPSWTPEKQSACARKYEMDGLQVLRFMTPKVLEIMEEVYSTTSLHEIFKLRKEEALLMEASYADYILHVPKSRNRGYESLRGQSAMGWLPDRLVDENEISWEINHRKCTPSFSMLMSQVATVQTAFGNTKNLHIHIVFPRPPSDRCDCPSVYSESECYESMLRNFINPELSHCQKIYNSQKTGRERGENASGEKHVAKSMRADQYRVNEMLGTLAAHLNDYEAVGNWHANMKTRYLTIWDNDAVNRLKLLLASDVLAGVESKTGGHSWGLYKNAFMAFRYGIYGADVGGMLKVGFEFRALRSQLSETQLKILTSSKAKLKDHKGSIEPYDVALYLQKVIGILKDIKDTSAVDVPVRIHNSNQRANTVTLGQINEYQRERRRVGMKYFGMYPRADVDFGRLNYEYFVSYCLAGDEDGDVDNNICVRSSQGIYFLRKFVAFVVKVLANDENLAKACIGEGATDFAARFIGMEEEALNQQNEDWDNCLDDLLKRWSFVALGGASMEELLRPKSRLKLQKKTWKSTMEKFFLNPLVQNCDPKNKDTTPITIKKEDEGYNRRIAYAFQSRSYTSKNQYSQCYRLWMGYVEFFHSWENIEPFFML